MDAFGTGRESALYELDYTHRHPPLKFVQALPTLGATDFRAFDIGGTTFLAVSNEQDDEAGGDVASTIWALAADAVVQRSDEL